MLVNGVKLRRWWFVTFCFSFFFSRSPGWSTISGSCFSTKGRGNDACDVGTDIFLPIIMQEFIWCLRRMHQFFFFFIQTVFLGNREREREKKKCLYSPSAKLSPSTILFFCFFFFRFLLFIFKPCTFPPILPSHLSSTLLLVVCRESLLLAIHSINIPVYNNNHSP